MKAILTDKQIQKVANSFMKGLLGNRKSAGWCYMASIALQSYLSFCGVEAELSECTVMLDNGDSWGHWYLTLANGNILDPIANQFNSGLPLVYIGAKPDYYLTRTEVELIEK